MSQAAIMPPETLINRKLLMTLFERSTSSSILLNPPDDPSLEPFLMSLALERQLHVFHEKGWASDVTTLESVASVGTMLMLFESSHSDSMIVEMVDSIALLTVGHGYLFVKVAAKSRAAASTTLDNLRPIFPEKIVADATLRVTFHSMDAVVCRSIAVPDWKSVCANYSTGTREHLHHLVESKAGACGQLLLWHGLPGTGKTYAVRALGWEWRDWCDLHYILDPEVFFGDASYLHKTILSEGSASPWTKPRWRLLIAEDTGELLTKDAKNRSGQGLSRLLNLVDGLIGQGLRIMVLITTNEKIAAMHDAVIRPGRCSKPLEFQSFSAEAANAWLAEQGQAPLVGTKPRTLAELFAGAGSSAPKVIGFAPSEQLSAA
jgi:hypothetical protein